MIQIERHTLRNGLTVIVHTDRSSTLATVNIRYKIGARNENEHRTGFAHLFEHLMFGGSRNVPNFDTLVQLVGGDNNAYTTNDFTNYYITLPAQNIETAFWVESDRLNELAFSEESLNVQRQVVMEEFKQRYLNVPYGDIGHLTRALAYKVHPYRWPTIGLTLDHIANASLDEVRTFFYNNYAPDNAVLCVCGNVDADRIFALAEKWFGSIDRQARRLPVVQEPVQTERRELLVERDVPVNFISLAYHMGGRTSRDYYVCDLITDVLSDGVSSRLTQRGVKIDRTVSEVDASIFGSYDPGMLSFTATLMPGTSFETVEQMFREEIDRIKQGDITDHELQKVKNRHEATKLYRQVNSQTKAADLCAYEILGDANLINTESQIYDSVTRSEMAQTLARICVDTNASALYYQSTQPQ